MAFWQHRINYLVYQESKRATEYSKSRESFKFYAIAYGWSFVALASIGLWITKPFSSQWWQGMLIFIPVLLIYVHFFTPLFDMYTYWRCKRIIANPTASEKKQREEIAKKLEEKRIAEEEKRRIEYEEKQKVAEECHKFFCSYEDDCLAGLDIDHPLFASDIKALMNSFESIFSFAKYSWEYIKDVSRIYVGSRYYSVCHVKYKLGAKDFDIYIAISPGYYSPVIPEGLRINNPMIWSKTNYFYTPKPKKKNENEQGANSANIVSGIDKSNQEEKDIKTNIESEECHIDSAITCSDSRIDDVNDKSDVDNVTCNDTDESEAGNVNNESNDDVDGDNSPYIDIRTELREYKSMLDEGLITKEDYDKKKRQLLHL